MTGLLDVELIKPHFSFIFMAEKDLVTKWEVSIIELENHVGKKYKVTRRFPDMSVSETKMFLSKRSARNQFNRWLE